MKLSVRVSVRLETKVTDWGWEWGVKGRSSSKADGNPLARRVAGVNHSHAVAKVRSTEDFTKYYCMVLRVEVDFTVIIAAASRGLCSLGRNTLVRSRTTTEFLIL